MKWRLEVAKERMISADLDREHGLICSRQLRETSDVNEYQGKVVSFHGSGRHYEE